VPSDSRISRSKAKNFAPQIYVLGGVLGALWPLAFLCVVYQFRSGAELFAAGPTNWADRILEGVTILSMTFLPFVIIPLMFIGYRAGSYWAVVLWGRIAPWNVTGSRLVEQLRTLGVEPGGVLVVHTAFSMVAPVEGGPRGLIEALRAALGPSGTLVMPSMADDDEHPFNPKETPCAGMGVVAETFWRMDGVLRSDSPHAFAAIGPKAEEITAPHPVDVPHGLDSPVGRVYEMDGQVLLLGVRHYADTTVHLAENLAGVRYRIVHHATVLRGGEPVRIEYREVDHCCEKFVLLDRWLKSEGRQRRGIVGYAEARLARSRDIVEAALARLRENETVFLHPPGVCEECDEARASLRR
jgi:aminoglycoside 3-N-acetyltransferase